MSKPSSHLAREFAAMLDGMGIVWIDEIATWIAPNEDGTHSILTSDEVRETLFDFMEKNDDGFTEGKLNGTFKMSSLKQKLKRQRLGETHIAFSDGKLDCKTFEFCPFPPQWSAGSYAKGDAVRFGKFDYTAKEDITDAAPPSSSSKWNRVYAHSTLALSSIDMTYAEAMGGNDGDCPRWIEFLRQIFVMQDGKTPSDELLSIIYPMCGYFLMPHLKGNRIFMLAGPTASNGKSTFLSIIKGLMPNSSVSEMKFKEFASARGSNWGKANLIGKKLVICNEESSRDIDAGLLKEFSDGLSTVQAERKFQNPFSFLPSFKIITAFNSPPDFDRVDQGTLRRFIYIPCNARFDGSTSVDEIVDGVMSERKAVLAWMIRQAKKLHDDKWRFPSEGEQLKAAKEEYMEDQNSVLAFCRENYVPMSKPAKGLPLSDIYEHYLLWCGTNGYKHPFGKKTFTTAAHVGILGESHASNGVRYRRCQRLHNLEL